MPVAYYLEKENENSATEAKKGKSVNMETLKELGVLYWKLDPKNYEEKLSKICKERNYTYKDFVRTQFSKFEIHSDPIS
jgi:hypothetical protein